MNGRRFLNEAEAAMQGADSLRHDHPDPRERRAKRNTTALREDRFGQERRSDPVRITCDLRRQPDIQGVGRQGHSTLACRGNARLGFRVMFAPSAAAE
jgi:hypothetical protein